MDENNATSPKLLTREEAANLLGLKPATLAKWAHTHCCRLKMIKLGSRVRYRVSDVEEFINKNSTGGSND
jgi:excisionase family DNA binding protein